MTDHMEAWNKLARPPKEALKTIRGGRISGMTDINPQWRFKAMTEQYGPCGVGWKYSEPKLWLESGANGEICAFASLNLSVKEDEWIDESGESHGPIWSEPIPGIGGSMLIEKEKHGLHTNDEAYKMAVTDALSVAMKALGVAADIYLGQWDGSKYKDQDEIDDQEREQAKAAPTKIMEAWLKSRHELADKSKDERIKYFKIWFERVTETQFTPVLNNWNESQILACQDQLAKEAQAHVMSQPQDEPADRDRREHHDHNIESEGESSVAGD